jgi:predicted DNA-binding protein
METVSARKSRVIQIQISDSLNRKLSLAARENGVTKSAFVRVALEREFALDQQLARECAPRIPSRQRDDPEDKKQLRLFKA